MNAQTNLTIMIDGQIMPYCLSFELSQPIHDHHYFKVTFNNALTDSSLFGSGSQLNGYVGKELKAEIASEQGEGLNFKGIITGVHVNGNHWSDQGQFIIIEGYSGTYLLENEIVCRAYTEKSLSEILNVASQGAIKNLLDINIAPIKDPTLTYTVQYNETPFAFLNRMAKRFGEWLYYDGKRLNIGKSSGTEVELHFGTDLYSFSSAVTAGPVHQKFVAQSYKNFEVLNSNTRSLSSAMSGAASEMTQASTALWHASPMARYMQSFDDETATKEQLENLTEIQFKGSTASRVRFSGVSAAAALTPGGVIKVFGGSFSNDEDMGSYIITAVHHKYQHGGNYSNSFEAVPFDVEASPLTDTCRVPMCDAQAGIVEDNNDPEGMGRIKVKLYWHKDTTTPWIRLTNTHAGKDKGVFFTPEIGEEVMVGYENSNAEKPFVLGSLYHGKAMPESWKSDKNDFKGIRTRSGHTIEFIDKSGEEKIKICDNEGSIIEFDTKKKSLFINSAGDIEISAKNVKINAEENVEIGAKKQIDIAAEKDLNAMANGALALQAQKDATVKSKTGAITVEAMKDATISGQNVTAEGKIKATFSGTQTNISGKMTALQGASGKIDVM